MTYPLICSNCTVHYDFDFTRVSARFGLKGPSRVVEALRENLVELNPEERRERDEEREKREGEITGREADMYRLSASDEIVEGESVAVPNKDVDLPKAFDEGKDELLLEDGVFTAVGAGSGAELGASILNTNVGILP